MLRKLFSVVILLLLVKATYGQDSQFWPLGFHWTVVDTNAALYGRLGIVQETDSTYRNDKLIKVQTTYYDKQGKCVNDLIVNKSAPDSSLRRKFRYDKRGRINEWEEYFLFKSDTVQHNSYRILKGDTAGNVYSYERIAHRADMEPQTETDDSIVSWKYVETLGKKRWKASSVYREVFSFEDVNEDVHIMRVTAFSRKDTLYKYQLTDTISKSSFWYSVDSYLSDGSRSYSLSHNKRLKETKSWKEGKLTEHHLYADSTGRGFRVVKTVVTDKLSKPSGAIELIVTYNDSVLTVTKGLNQLLIDYHAKPVYYETNVPPPPVYEPPSYGGKATFDSYFPYKKRTQVNSEITKTEYYNFSFGNLKPFYVIWRRKDGVIVAYMQLDTYAKRSVYTK
jgi:hypothetical protein